ncbi:MAG: hypothetical protein ABIO92_02645 [Chloroflexia bacterium]
MYSQKDPDPNYLSYLLRLWRTRDDNGKPVWCASLEEPGSHLTESFADVGGMYSFLQDQLDIEQPGEDARQEQKEQQAAWEQPG